MPFHKVERVLVDKMGRVTLLFGFHFPMPPIVPHVISHMTDEIDIAAVVTDKFIEPMILGMKVVRILGIPLMPFSNQTGGIADLF